MNTNHTTQGMVDMSIEWITFWGIFGGVIAGALLSCGLSFFLWKLQFNEEQKTIQKKEWLMRFNYINDLLIECRLNLNCIDICSKKKYKFYGLHTEMLRKFEKNYHPYFTFHPCSRTDFLKASYFINCCSNEKNVIYNNLKTKTGTTELIGHIQTIKNMCHDALQNKNNNDFSYQFFKSVKP